MINLLLGPPGGGKSYEAVAFHVLPALEKNRKIITNLPLNIEAISALYPQALTLIEIRTKTLAERPEIDWQKAESLYKKFGIAHKSNVFNPSAFAHRVDFGDTWRHPDNGSGPLYIIDECHIPLPRSSTPREVDEWFSLHRHESADVLLITQSYGKVSKSIIDLVQVVYRVKKNTAFGSADSYIRKVQDGVRGDVVNTAIRKYDSQYFKFYQSHTRGGGSELAANDIVPFWKRWPFIGLAICILIFVLILPKACSNNPFDAKKYQKKPIPANTKRPETKSLIAPVSPGESVPVQTASLIKSVDTDSQNPTIQQPITVQPKTDNFLSGHGLHIVGFNRIDNKTVYFLLVSQNATSQFVITSPELIKAGYEFEGFTACLAAVKKEDFNIMVSCDSPALLNLANNSPRT
jgi:zona occludens toxin